MRGGSSGLCKLIALSVAHCVRYLGVQKEVRFPEIYCAEGCLNHSIVFVYVDSEKFEFLPMFRVGPDPF